MAQRPLLPQRRGGRREKGRKPEHGLAAESYFLLFPFSGSALGVLDRMAKDGVPVVRGLETDVRHGHMSFFVRGPDGLLIEMVEDKPIPEGTWAE